MLGLGVSDDRFDRRAAAEFAFDRLGEAASLARDIDLERAIGRSVVAAIAAVGDDAREVRADLRLDLRDHGRKGVAVVGACYVAEPIDDDADVADPAQPDPLEMLVRKEAVKTAVSRFAELPTLQRSVVILKDVLDESLIEIAALLDLTVDAVKGHLARGRAHLREINANARPLPDPRPASAAVARYVALFNQRDWEGLRRPMASRWVESGLLG